MTDKSKLRRGDAPGCLLLGGAGVVTLFFGAMVLGSYFPDLAKDCFTVACAGLAASAVLAALLAAVSDVKLRREQSWKLKGEHLDHLGTALGVIRMYLEPDTRYRERIGKALKGSPDMRR